MSLRILEFYAGIGGMHAAMIKAQLNARVVAAFEINEIALQVYSHHYPDVECLQQSIEHITLDQLQSYHADIFLMSPPCQPYTRQLTSNQKGEMDPRSTSYVHLLTLIGSMSNPPLYILLENVSGFASSSTRDKTVQVLSERGFRVQEYLLCPREALGIPNSRLRYYMIAKRGEKHAKVELHRSLPSDLAPFLPSFQVRSIENYLTEMSTEALAVPEHVLWKFGEILDICFLDSNKSCCFTKNYSRYVEGTGSVLQTYGKMTERERVYDIYRSIKVKGHSGEPCPLLELGLRYFSPSEIASLLGFPNSFHFPDNVSRRQMYSLLGNSLSIDVVSCLLWFLVHKM